MIHGICVCLHGIAPASWRDCERLLAAVAMAGDIPVTLLVRPEREPPPAWFPRALAARVERGDELALCETPQGTPLWHGRSWFHRHGLPLSGFMPLDGRLGRHGWHALRAQGFRYAVTRRQFHLLAPRRDFPMRCATYRARTRLGLAIALLRNRDHHEPLARLSLHPQDAALPHVLDHAIALIERLAVARQPMTLQDLAGALRSGRYPRPGGSWASVRTSRR
jgi:predicted deacetylase